LVSEGIERSRGSLGVVVRVWGLDWGGVGWDGVVVVVVVWSGEEGKDLVVGEGGRVGGFDGWCWLGLAGDEG
jgi:hypothetical protein